MDSIRAFARPVLGIGYDNLILPFLFSKDYFGLKHNPAAETHLRFSIMIVITLWSVSGPLLTQITSTSGQSGGITSTTACRGCGSSTERYELTAVGLNCKRAGRLRLD